MIFVYRAWISKDLRYYLLIGLVLGEGFYSYLGFYPFAIFMLLLLTYHIFKEYSKKKKILSKYFIVLLFGLFISANPFLAYGIKNPSAIVSRTNDLSPSHVRNIQELITGVAINVSQLKHVFFNAGNTHPDYNPSDVGLFDVGTFFVLIIGFGCMLRYNKKMFFVVLLLFLPALMNDIFSFQFLSNGAIDYGYDHPDALRLAGIIPIFYFITAYAFSKIYYLGRLEKQTIIKGIISIVTCGICLYNWQIYFNHPVDARITSSSETSAMQLVTLINDTSAKTVLLPRQLIEELNMNRDLVDYFVKNKFTTQPFNPYSANEVLAAQPYADLIIVGYKQNPGIGDELLAKINGDQIPFGTNIKVVTYPDQSVDSFILGRSIESTQPLEVVPLNLNNGINSIYSGFENHTFGR